MRPDATLVADGYGIHVSVRRGRLVIKDGMGRDRRHRELSRIDRDVHRLVILADTGTVSLDAVRWCADVGIAIVQLDRNGRVLLTESAPGIGDPRLRRALAAAPNSPVGVQIARALLDAKLAGQAAVAADGLGAHAVAESLERDRERLTVAPDLVECRAIEAGASSRYFGAWSASVQCRFAACDTARVPEHWRVFAARSSPLAQGGRSPRNAASPITAMQNFGYALAEAECRLALITVGLDPGLGVVHTDRKDRDSLALDLLEPIRPLVDRHVLQLLAVRHFRFADFYETRHGVCRVLAPLTGELADRMPEYARAIGPVAEQVAHTLAGSSPGKVLLRTPLSRANHIAAQTRGARSAKRQAPKAAGPMPTCRECGEQLWERGRQLCTGCWPVTRTALATQRARAGLAAIAEARATGKDPTQTAGARAKRREGLVAQKSGEAAWRTAGVPAAVSEGHLRGVVIPALSALSIKDLQRATGLSASGCSMIRSGKRTPHPRHWDALATLAHEHSLF